MPAIVAPKSPVNQGGATAENIDDLHDQWVRCRRLSVLGDADVNTLAIRKQPGWVTLTLVNSWVTNGAPYPTPAFRIEPLLRIVRLRGIIKSGANNTSPFTLPPQARPANQLALPSQGNTTGACYLVVPPTGVALVEFGGTLSFFILDGMTFPLQ